MLYIKFEIKNHKNFMAFRALYNHMLAIRTKNYKAKEDGDEIDDFIDEDKQKIKLFDKLIPEDTSGVLGNYFSFNNAKSILMNEDKVSYINYLEYGFEVNLDLLERCEIGGGIVKISTGNYPFGGLERFMITLKAFKLAPFEYFDGFNLCAINWVSDVEYDANILSEKTKEYLIK
ncbi:hypothetical protein [Polaribacter sp. Hel_I_88]|uniref:hypothetical protein n=1 Tax=Polaribacter sp. Hel_I_88 TaxID=1250006 RepID=UPI00047B7F3B|nr:hypothetical protein [Polaribacter sp. Hel_I_88]